MRWRSVTSALLLSSALVGPAGAQPDATPEANKPDAGAPLVVVPNGSAAPAQAPGESPGLPPPPALDSKRTPMPDRLANDHWLQYFPLAPPTPPVPDSSGKTGGGPKKVNTIFGPTGSKGAAGGKGATGGAPPDIPRDSVTRTPEDQMAPPSPSSTP
jgi:hypothetical protein